MCIHAHVHVFTMYLQDTTEVEKDLVEPPEGYDSVRGVKETDQLPSFFKVLILLSLLYSKSLDKCYEFLSKVVLHVVISECSRPISMLTHVAITPSVLNLKVRFVQCTYPSPPTTG